jgi:DNA helicase-2/ATP-dependent DNA helicase PcrA
MESRFLREIDTDCLDGADKIGSDTTSYFHGAMGAEDGFASAEIFRPFDSIQRIKREVSSHEENRPIPKFEIGDEVSHPKFGEGTVIEFDGKAVTVIFGEAGKKRLAAGLAPLEKI